MNILGIETSCDETAAAVVRDGKTIVSSVVASSAAMHKKYGGIVPEVAARKQVESIIPVITEALSNLSKNDIDAIAVTYGPGLIGSLLVGVEAAKTLAFAWNKPLIPVNHVIAHMYANFLSLPLEKENSSRAKSRDIRFPAISLVVSGGHTELFLMTNAQTLIWLGGTIDDAAGEAFDKAARLLGFANAGGPAIEHTAQKFEIRNSKFEIRLPRPLLHDGTLNFSFSGLKTAILREWQKNNPQPTTHNSQLISAFAYEIQEAITDVLVAKTLKAAELHQAKSILVSGGVAANKRLREKLNQQLTTNNLQLFAPPLELCTDNAASIAACAYYQNQPKTWKEVIAAPNLSVEINKL